VLQRAKERAGIEIGQQCQACFNTYCWDGTINTTAHAYDPVLKSDNGTFSMEGQSGKKEWCEKDYDEYDCIWRHCNGNFGILVYIKYL
jgi:hypothetical protein